MGSIAERDVLIVTRDHLLRETVVASSKEATVRGCAAARAQGRHLSRLSARESTRDAGDEQDVIAEQIDELRRRIRIIEGDKTANYEQYKDMILQLQQQDEKQRPEPLPEVVQRFASQRGTQTRLEKMKEDNNKSLLTLREEKNRLEAELKEMKDSEQAKRSSAQQMVEEVMARLGAVEKRRDVAEENSQQVTCNLNKVNSKVKFLNDKLDHIKQPKSHVPAAPVTLSSEELLSQAAQKVLLLMEKLKGKELGAIMKEMNEKKFLASIAHFIPYYNIRIKLPEIQSDDEEEDSDEDEPEVFTRDMLERQSQRIVDSQTKGKEKRSKKKKKKGN
ncbi:outer dynein arm-docking complex subunit 3 [Amia ocellicauda]|uniref:outer dynein arm-docking complex subunit 3 n=1 Tax=Amia ocellicauda TaxID=2972642 RepID=UPI0034649122